MRPEDIWSTYPTIYHMAEGGSWASIRKNGLLSTKALLDLFEVEEEQCETIEKRHRPDSVEIHHPKHGQAVVRDQRPMSDSGLRRALPSEVSPGEWYSFLNSKSFFWPTRNRLKTMMGAYKDRDHDVLFVNTEGLITAFESQVLLSHMNSGATKPMPHPRNFDTFKTIADYPFDDRKRLRGKDNAIAEIVIGHGVTNISKYVEKVVRMRNGEEVETLWSK